MSFSPQALAHGIRNQNKAALDWLLSSDLGSQLYTVCEKACLGYVNEAEDLFRRTLQRALKNPDDLKDSIERWLFSHFHAEWQRFARQHPELGASSAPLTFDWERLDARQADDALLKLNPPEREIFIYRFFLKYSLNLIERLTSQSTEEVQNLFHSCLRKVMTS